MARVCRPRGGGEAVPSQRQFIFTITPGHTGTTWLSRLLGENLPDSSVFHEILGYDRFGVDTPDVSHMTLFNSQGNVPQVRAFWERKAQRILARQQRYYGETSHLLAKCGLMENIDLFTDAGQVHILCLDRDFLALVRSMRRRGDMLNKGDQWLWHLDPDYPRKLLSTGFFLPHGIDGLRLWYACEMRTRAAYYRQMFAGETRVSFITTSLEALSGPAAVAGLLAQLGCSKSPDEIAAPARANASGGDFPVEEEPIAGVIEQMQFDPEGIARDYLGMGYRLGHPVARELSPL